MNKRQRKKWTKLQNKRAAQQDRGFAAIADLSARSILETMQRPGFLAGAEERLAHFNATHDWVRTVAHG